MFGVVYKGDGLRFNIYACYSLSDGVKRQPPSIIQILVRLEIVTRKRKEINDTKVYIPSNVTSP
jgi:hypothetical protein